MAIPQTPAQKLTDLRIQRALAKPGAYGMKGFLLYTEAAAPKPIRDAILKAASKYTPGVGVPTLASPVNGGFGYFGDGGFVYGSIATDDGSTDPTDPVPSGVTNATSSQPASSSWVSDIANAIKVAGTAALGFVQMKDAQSIFNVNLQRAQQGLPPIPTNPTQYGLPAPTANIGLTSSTQKTLLWIVAGIGGAILLGSFAKGHRAK